MVNCPFSAAFLYPGLIGPGIPLNQSGAGGSAREDVTLAAGFDSDFFNFFPWKLQKDGNSSGKYDIGGFVISTYSLFQRKWLYHKSVTRRKGRRTIPRPSGTTGSPSPSQIHEAASSVVRR